MSKLTINTDTIDIDARLNDMVQWSEYGAMLADLFNAEAPGLYARAVEEGFPDDRIDAAFDELLMVWEAELVLGVELAVGAEALAADFFALLVGEDEGLRAA